MGYYFAGPGDTEVGVKEINLLLFPIIAHFSNY